MTTAGALRSARGEEDVARSTTVHVEDVLSTRRPVSRGTCEVDGGQAAREREIETSETSTLSPSPAILALGDVRPEDRPRVGGKVLPLARLAADGLPVPPGVVLPTDTFRAVLLRSGLHGDAVRAGAGDLEAAARLHEALLTVALPADLLRALEVAARELGGVVAVRSSGVDEDGRERSFAGQHETVLGVGPDGIADAVRRCWASLYAPRALAYRSAPGANSAPAGPAPGALAVLVQRLVDPRVAGVMFTINPMTGSWREMTVEAVFGLAEGLVSGQVAPHWYLVRRPRRTPRPVQRVLARVRLQRLQSDVHPIDRRWVRREGQVVVEPVPDALARRATLSPHDLRRLCRLGLRVEAHLGAPQDVEWAQDASGRLWLLQARPVTTGQAPRARKDVLWTRRFVGERFPEPLTPLAWSLTEPLLDHFIAYPEVQRRYLGGGPALRLVNQRVYLNASVFPHLAFKLPGMPAPRFMLELLPPDQAAAFRRRFAVMPDAAVYRAIFKTTFEEERWRRFAWNPFTNPDRWDAFEEELLGALPGLARTPVSAADGLRLVDDALALLGRYVGIHVCSLLFANMADQLVEGMLNVWLPERAKALLDALATTPPGNKTLELNAALWSLAQHAEPTDLERLAEGSLEGPFKARFDAFLRAYGQRSAASWDVFAPRWRDDPRALIPLLRGSMDVPDDPAVRAREQQARFEAARTEALAGIDDGARRAVLRRGIDLLRTYLLLRENQRFRFEQLQDALRGTLLWLGGELVRRGALDRADDVRFLTHDEVRGLLTGELELEAARGFVDRREAAFAEAAERPAPAFLRGDDAVAIGPASARLQGHGISPGRVRGTVRRVRSLADGERLQQGEILVAPAVDPAWTPLFLLAGGAVLELGGRLSHGAVVAREYGVPAVVNVDDAMTRLQDGDEVTVDGTRGLVFVHG